MKQEVILAMAVTCLMALAGCEGDSEPAGAVNLGIPDRAWAPGHDDVGWCGETCIQMSLGYYGYEISQEEINRAAGSPADITEVDMDRALQTLGVKYKAWDESNSDVNQYIAWVKANVQRGHPVICGTKIYPDEHPDWYVDHFVLAVGYDETRMLVNTQLDCDGPQWIAYEALAAMEDGYSFQNLKLRYFGRAIIGVP